MKPCVRCLLAEVDPQGLYAAVQQAVAQLEPERRCGQAAYQKRLAACRSCAHLRDGMCAKCGCFVELRAAKRLLGCPAVPPLWLPEP